MLERTQVDRLTLMDHFAIEGHKEHHFVLEEPLFVEAGAIISIENGRHLVVEHPDGSSSRHVGGEEMWCRGWEPIGSVVGRRVEAETPEGPGNDGS